MRKVSAELWYMALASEVGVIIRTDDPHEAREELYAIQRGLKDPDLDDVVIVEPGTDPNDLMLVKHSVARQHGYTIAGRHKKGIFD